MVYSSHLPDNFLVFSVLVEEMKCVNRNSCYFVRDKNKTNIDKFHENLRNIVWSDIPGYNDPQYAYIVCFWINLQILTTLASH